MKKNILSLFFIFSSFISYGQNTLVWQWDKRFGGVSNDPLKWFQQTADAGFILGGYAYSGISGDKTQNTWGGNDYWIVKLDYFGNKEWDKDFGGTNNDLFYSLEQTADGGYILGGWSRSGIGGDKSEPCFGEYDFWILKIDSLGNKEWDKTFGGVDDDFLYAVHQTSDGGYILGGTTNSGIGGNKTEALVGGYDYWIVKTDSLGNKEWENDLGGTLDDLMFSFQPTKDKGFILGGNSNSGIGGDKTQPLWTAGYTDYWIIKLDSSGVIEWDKNYGGLLAEYLQVTFQSDDGGYVFVGISQSGIGGDKTQTMWGNWDYWILKTDSLGNKEWDKDFGGFLSEDEVGSISHTSDKGFLLSGDSYSDISGDKTENNLGYEQGWLLKLDSVGSKEWEKTILTTGHDEQSLSVQTIDGCYVVAHATEAGIGGYKTQPNRDSTNASQDYWLVKFCDSAATPVVAFTSANQLCAGTCTDFINLSSPATSYQWTFTGANPSVSTDVNPQGICYTTPGSYDVTLIATNVHGSDTLTLTNFITVFSYPASQGIIQNGDTLFANAGATSYQWYFNGNVITGATNYFYVAQASGDYNVVATDANGCEVEAVIFNVVAFAQFKVSGLMFKVYPNPAIEKLEIRNLKLEATVEISIYNLFGEKVFQTTSTNIKPTQSVDVSSILSGIYYLEIISAEKTFRAKFVKE